jgi:hypothetical protein
MTEGNTVNLLALSGRLRTMSENAKLALTPELAKRDHDVFVLLKQFAEDSANEADRLEAHDVFDARQRWEERTRGY